MMRVRYLICKAVLPDVRIDRLTLASDDRIAVTGGGVEEYYRRADLSKVALDSGTPLLDPSRVPFQLPYLFKQFQAERLSEVRDDVEALFAIVMPEPVALDEPACVYENAEAPSFCSRE